MLLLSGWEKGGGVRVRWAHRERSEEGVTKGRESERYYRCCVVAIWTNKIISLVPNTVSDSSLSEYLIKLSPELPATMKDNISTHILNYNTHFIHISLTITK